MQTPTENKKTPEKPTDEITEANRRFPLKVQDEFLRRAFLDGVTWARAGV